MNQKNTSSQQKSKKDYTDFLNEHQYFYERANLGIEIYPSDAAIETFKEIAASINPQMVFSPQGCQECVQSLVIFVYENINKTQPLNAEGEE